MARIHTLTFTDLHKTIPDAVVATLSPENTKTRDIDFTQGQHLTFQRDFDGEELRWFCRP